MSVVVVGAGISGLAAALDLGRAGVPTLIVESTDRPGGKIGTEHVDGLTIEHGPDSMLTTRPAAVALAREVGLDADLIGVREPRTVHIVRDGRSVPLPQGLGLILPTRIMPFVATPLFSWPEKARMALDVVMPRVMGPGDVSVGAFLRRRLGPALVDRLAGPLVGGIYGTAIDELSLDAVVPTLRDAERDHRSLLLAGLADGRRMRAAAAGPDRPDGHGAAAGAQRALGVFASLVGGLGDLVAATVRSVEATGVVTLALGVRATALDTHGPGVRVHLSDGRRIAADAAILTAPGRATADLLGSTAPVAAAAIAAIPHASSCVVTLAYPVDGFRTGISGHGWLIPASEGIPVSALTVSSNKWAGRAPDGIVLIRAFLPGEAAATGTPASTIALAEAAVQRIAGARVPPLLARVATFDGSMPRYTVGHQARVLRAEHDLAAHPSIVLAGAPYRGVGLPDCITSGRGAAGSVLARLGVEAIAV